jgi:hypothetical protein
MPILMTPTGTRTVVHSLGGAVVPAPPEPAPPIPDPRPDPNPVPDPDPRVPRPDPDDVPSDPGQPRPGEVPPPAS